MTGERVTVIVTETSERADFVRIWHAAIAADKVNGGRFGLNDLNLAIGRLRTAAERRAKWDATACA